MSQEGEVIAPGTTGRYLVLLRQDAIKSAAKTLRDTAGLKTTSTADFEESAVAGEHLAEAEAFIFEDLGVAVVNTPPEQIKSLSAAAAEDSAILAVEPERIVYALRAAAPAFAPPVEETIADVPEYFSAPTMDRGAAAAAAEFPVEFLRGYREAVDHLVGRLLAIGGVTEEAVGEAVAAAFSETEFTWGSRWISTTSGSVV